MESESESRTGVGAEGERTVRVLEGETVERAELRCGVSLSAPSEE
ncbi:MAG: hypothetical protein ABEJ26_14840 [Halosimplex sp.]